MAEIWDRRVPHFLSNVLSSKVGSINRGALWVIAFEDLPSLVPGIEKALSREGKDWAIAKARDAVLGNDFQTNRGCVFAQAIDVPGESLVVNPEGNIMSNGYLRSYVGQGRNQMPEMRVTFLDTNVSFADNFLRPWVISTANFGMWLGGKDKYRTNMICYKLGAYSADSEGMTDKTSQAGPTVVMTMTFYDICCTSVSNEEINYAPSTTPQMREARFVYNYYSVDTTKNNLFIS